MYRKLIILAAVWTFCVVVLGAYVRLSDAGLGCPDWPGCYGKITPLHAAEQIQAAHADSPYGPVSMAKAWKEMIHRFLASGLGVLIIAIAAIAYKQRSYWQQSWGLHLALIGVVCLQGALGAWTVTLLLKPAIVTAHLIGGLTTFALLIWLTMRQLYWSRPGNAAPRLLPWARLGLLIVITQIVLGGWVSTNYAALACADFPTCQGQIVPQMAFADAFHLARELGQTADGQVLSTANLTAIHWLHRLGALVTFCYIMLLAWRLYASRVLRSLAVLLGLALLLQVVLGIANIMFKLPLPVAVAHNAGAACLLATMIAINFRMVRR